jgi:isocitrate dehydrogenase
VLREGNSDRASRTSVKQYARSHPHSMGDVEQGFEVARGQHGRRRLLRQRAVGRHHGGRQAQIELSRPPRWRTVAQEGVAVDAGDVLGASMMSRRASRVLRQADRRCQGQGVLLSLHLKATMMKVSDPIMFGHAVDAYYKDVFEKHAATFRIARRRSDNGIGDVYKKIQTLPADTRAAIEADLQAVYATRPSLAMVDSSKGITNLHVPSDVIIDASMPAAIRSSGRCGDRTASCTT